jgi:hypothetical protein
VGPDSDLSKIVDYFLASAHDVEATGRPQACASSEAGTARGNHGERSCALTTVSQRPRPRIRPCPRGWTDRVAAALVGGNCYPGLKRPAPQLSCSNS